MRTLMCLSAILALVLAGPRAYAQSNRTPVDDDAFSRIADLYEYDRSLPLRAEVISTQTHDGRQLPYLTDKVHFRSIHDEVVVGYFAYQRDSTHAKCPTVILLHANNRYRGSHDTWTTRWLDILVREGYCALAIDQYGYGERFVTGKAANVVGEMGPYERRDVVIQQVVDARRAIDYLHNRAEVDTTKIALMGESLGGYITCLVAGLEPRLRTVVLVVTGPWPDGPTGDRLLAPRHTLNFAPRISAPVLMVSASGDGVDKGEELFALLPEPKRIVWHQSEHVILVDDQKPDILKWLGLYFR